MDVAAHRVAPEGWLAFSLRDAAQAAWASLWIGLGIGASSGSLGFGAGFALALGLVAVTAYYA